MFHLLILHPSLFAFPSWSIKTKQNHTQKSFKFLPVSQSHDSPSCFLGFLFFQIFFLYLSFIADIPQNIVLFGTCYVAQDCLKRMILLPQSSLCCYYGMWPAFRTYLLTPFFPENLIHFTIKNFPNSCGKSPSVLAPLTRAYLAT